MWTPLQQFRCDKCGEIIQSSREGILEFTDELDPTTGYPLAKEFKIVHHNAYSPNKVPGGRGCSIHYQSRNLRDVSLDELLNDKYGTAYLISFLDAGNHHIPNYMNQLYDNREYAELMRRLLIPHYEEARQYWGQAQADGLFDGENEAGIYGNRMLLDIIQRYAPN